MRRKIALFFSFFLIVLTFLPLGRLTWGKDFSPKKIYKKYASSIVFIFASNGKNNGMGGTGSIIRKDGLIITNAHVIFDDESKTPYKTIFVYLKPHKLIGDMDRDLTKRYKTKVLYYQNDLDLALLQMEGIKNNLPPIEFANPDDISIGEDVLAIGHPEQGGLWSLTTGTISAIKANFQNIAGKDVFQTEASLNKGNSGGPLLDKRGYMVGINSNIARKNSQGLAITDINFSIKSSVAKKWLKNKGYNIKYGKLPLEERPEPELETIFISPPKEPMPEIPVMPVKKIKKKKVIIQTEKRPYNMDKFVKHWSVKIVKEMEDLMDEMHKKVKKKKSNDIFEEF